MSRVPHPGWVRRAALGLSLAWLALAGGCAAAEPPAPRPTALPVRLAAEEARMDDGYRLPLRRWGDGRAAKGLVLAVHGFNDYSAGFAGLGPYLAARGFLVYSYDQRGFGAAKGRGLWAGEDRLIADLRALAASLHRRHPTVPLYLVGESMGGAEIMAAGTVTHAAGIVLLAPAVWSRDTMPLGQRLLLAVAASTVPWLEVTGEGFYRPPSDNVPMLRAHSKDPLVIKGTRIDALWGLANLMDRARAAAPGLSRPALVLYGERDKIVPREAFCATLADLPAPAPDVRIVLYAQGWHMLTRDLQGQRVMADVAAWLGDPRAPLPSGEEVDRAGPRMRGFCGDGRPPAVPAPSEPTLAGSPNPAHP